ncbi:hypothetical protein PSJE_27550 [Pseudomonas jessenii]|uniref:Uncharacterized protein n=2 Tax=Pseudomonas TaxID=286 RepID=A0A231FZ13_PSEJE|nr:hypothetical protein PSJE_27550 [Pseudomonas jessenii]SEC54551.1 hypothetical protein SAMN04490187_4774 [Pseudomonas jessenii]VVP83914.1 hypothetical protein PS922_02083 [Pseudomonas fluorescens]
MVVNDAACLLTERGALESIASELAPTGFAVFQHSGDLHPCQRLRQIGPQVLDILDAHRQPH